MGCNREVTLRRPPNRAPRAPQLALERQRPEVAGDVFVEKTLHEGLHLEGVRFADIDAGKVELRRFVLAEVDLSGACCRIDAARYGLPAPGSRSTLRAPEGFRVWMVIF
jgi:hypothetical protein